MISYGIMITYILCENSQLKRKFLQELHTSPIRGHSRFLKMYHKMKKDFLWEGLKIDVQFFLSECVLCQQNKGEDNQETKSPTTISYNNSMLGRIFN
jgi:hypothetical protein